MQQCMMSRYWSLKLNAIMCYDLQDKSLEDRQESFFLSETVKVWSKKKVYRSSFIALQYLYLLFDVDNPVNLHASNYLFTTEGHILPISNRSSKLSTWLVYLLFDTVYIGFVTKAGKRKAFSATTHQIHLHPLLLPSPIQGSFVTEFSAYLSFISLGFQYMLIRVAKNSSLVHFSLGSLPTSQNCDSISLEQRFSLPLRQVHIFPPHTPRLSFLLRNRYLQQIFAALGLT